MRTALWTLFGAILAVISGVALRACILSLPGYGVVIERCPSPLAATLEQPVDETDLLVRQLQSLRMAAALVPDCEGLPEKSEIALPEIKKAEQVVLILDTSSSMNDSEINYLKKLHKNVAKERAKAGVNRTEIDNALAEISARLRLIEASTSNSPSRIPRLKIAKDAIVPLVKNPIDDFPVSLWQYGATCKAPPKQVFPSGNRNAVDVLDALAAEAGQSPLGQAIKNIPLMIADGAGKASDRVVNVLLFVDGDETCEDDICLAAQELKQSHPFVHVHIVAISDDLQRLRCITEATGGGMIESQDPEKIRDAAKTIVQRSQ